MTGLERIIEQITAEADSVAKQKLRGAEAEATAILKDAEREAEKRELRLREQSAAECKSYRERMQTRAEFIKRTELLQAKQRLISEVIETAYQTMLQAESVTYFQYLEQLLDIFVRPQQGIICFSKEDLARLPFGFKARIKALAAQRGGALKISEEERKIEGGFILIYGGIEENCTFRALFDAKREELTDRVQEWLFS